MNVLVLGGTVFLGRHLVDALLAYDHSVTIFNRGTHDVSFAKPVTRIVGDRRSGADLARIPQAGWDAVLDLITEAPEVIRASADHLCAADRYVYVSSVSVYRDLSTPGNTEDSPIFAPDAGPFDDEAAQYGWRKARSEEAVRDVFGDARSTIVRPGLIVGPNDPSDRFSAWPRRFAAGGTAVVPAPAERAVQFIDARDVAEFIIRLIEHSIGGTFNVTSPRGAISMADVVAACRANIDDPAHAAYVSADFLADRGIEGWIDLPLWISPRIPYGGIMDVDVSRALAAGIAYRSLADTLEATRAWLRDAPEPETRAGLSFEVEAELLRAWKSAS